MTTPETEPSPLREEEEEEDPLNNNNRNENTLEPPSENCRLVGNPFISNDREASPSNRRFSSFGSLNFFKDGDMFLMDKRRPNGGLLLQGPRRLLRLCIFGTILPVLLISIPLYVRLMLYPPYHYSMAPTDQRLLDQRTSSIWCQAQNIQMNGTFNAYLMKDMPKTKKQLKSHSMLKHLRLSDDVKEYWGFFLQKGSIVTINLCTRHDGGILMIMRGLHNLRKCAWIGDDSAELDEDHLDSSNESGQVPEIYHDVPIVREDGNLLMENNGMLIKMNATLPKETTAKTSVERKIELDYYLQKAIELSKHKKEVFQLLNKKTKKNARDRNKKNRNNKKRNKKKKQDSVKESDEKESPDSSIISDLMRVKRNLEIDSDFEGMEILDDEDIQETEAQHGRQNSSTEVSNDIKEMYLKLFHLPTGLTYARGKINTTTSHDTSNEEERSSFSSSEEALTKCEGLLGLMPLYHSPICHSFNDAKTNRIKYKIPVTGTYYFVFSSDNEVFTSEIYFNMTLQRVVFDTDQATDECLNQTDCSLDVPFWSDDQTVIKLPESDWDAAYTLDVTCQPRVIIYLSILIMIPIAILFCTLY